MIFFRNDEFAAKTPPQRTRWVLDASKFGFIDAVTVHLSDDDAMDFCEEFFACMQPVAQWDRGGIYLKL